MKIHTGKTELPGSITFMQDGYWFQGIDDTEYRFIPYKEPQPMTHTINKMFGFSAFGIFFGIMTLRKK